MILIAVFISMLLEQSEEGCPICEETPNLIYSERSEKKDLNALN